MKRILVVITVMMYIFNITAFAETVDYGEELEGTSEINYVQQFSDVPETHWAFTYISELVDRGVISGYPDGKFRPENYVSRAEFAKMMVAIAGIEPVEVSTSSFVDLDSSDWSLPYVEAAKEYLTGYVDSNGNLLYKPDENTLREDVAVALVKIKGYDSKLADLSIIEAMFTDVDGISEAAKDYVAIAVENGLVSGYSDETFRAQQPVTRAEAATMLWRAYQYGNDNKITELDEYESQEEVIEEDVEDNSTVDEVTYTVNTVTQFGDIEDLWFYTTSMVVTKEHDVFYIDENNIMMVRGDGAEHEVLVDYINELPLIEDKEILAEGLAGKVFSPAEYVQLLYDAFNDKVYLVGYYEVTDWPVAIYEITGGNIVLYDIFEYPPYDFRGWKIGSYVAEDGSFVFGGQIKLNDGVYSRLPYDGQATDTRFELDNNYYVLDVDTFEKYRFNTGEFIKISSDHVNYDIVNHSFTPYSGMFYYADESNSVYQLSLEGDSTKEISAEDIVVQDGLTLNIDRLYIYSDNEYFFFDRESNALRYISINTDN